ncbi:MAG TPA: DUF29 domain-containing protein, partial [Phormidium sp.]
AKKEGTMISLTELKDLYQKDEIQGLETTIKLLKNRQFDSVDLENLIEELEELGRRERNSVVSLLEQIIRHLLLLQFWTNERDNNSAYWKGEIYTFRLQLNRKLTTTLLNYLEDELEQIYQDARGYVELKTQNSVEFPSKCPYSLDELRDPTWWSEEV